MSHFKANQYYGQPLKKTYFAFLSLAAISANTTNDHLMTINDKLLSSNPIIIRYKTKIPAPDIAGAGEFLPRIMRYLFRDHNLVQYIKHFGHLFILFVWLYIFTDDF